MTDITMVDVLRVFVTGKYKEVSFSGTCNNNNSSNSIITNNSINTDIMELITTPTEGVVTEYRIKTTVTKLPWYRHFVTSSYSSHRDYNFYRTLTTLFCEKPITVLRRIYTTSGQSLRIECYKFPPLTLLPSLVQCIVDDPQMVASFKQLLKRYKCDCNSIMS